jgi:uncharacterized protein with HEPN domain
MRAPESSLGDILAFARRAISYVDGVSAGDFADSVGVQDQVIRCLEVVGEAARRTPDHVRMRYPTVPWAQMSGMRNRLAHEYDVLDLDSVWLTATRDLPVIVAVLEGNPDS